MKLTIGIPTYNRANLLFNLLENISQQIRGAVNFEVEILVSDNASTDNTFDIIKSFKDSNPDIKIKLHSNNCNIGYDENVNMLFQLATGDYVMTLSDDDGLESNAINTIKNILDKNYGVKIVYIANNFYDCNLKNKVDINDPFFKNIGNNRYFQSAKDLFLTSKAIFGGISGLCIERKSWLETNVKKYFGTNWIHLGVTLNILIYADIYVIAEPLIKYRMDNKGSRWNSLETSLGIQRILLEFYKIFPNVIEEIYNEHRHQTRLSLIYLDCSKHAINKKKLLSNMRMAFDVNNLSFWLIDLPLLYLPSILLKWTYSLYSQTKKITRKIFKSFL
ncbi:glycosyltransferase family 2 protein [Polynucleobacter paneuropaeus]|nr:glycosyltransferase family 2 protein [Polynucleobacter paneuropaeus]